MNLCVDVIDGILSRLPMKSLIRFQGVCKDWYLKIQSQSFITRHLKNQTGNEKKLICHHEHPSTNYIVSICSEKEEEEDDDDDSLALFHQSKQQKYFIRDMLLCDLKDDNNSFDEGEVEIIGTCNGIVCLELNNTSITLWNPATRHFNTLPPFEPRPHPPGTRICGETGFGFDCTLNDYKVIRILYFEKKGYPMLKEFIFQIKIYSLNSNSWKEFDGSGFSARILLCLDHSYRSLFGNEKFCWLATRIPADKEKKGWVILSFDMGKEIFQETPLPSTYRAFVKIGGQIKIYNLQDSIALVLYDKTESEKTFEIWSSNDLGKGPSSWIKMFVIGPLSGIDRLLGLWKCKNSNELLFLFYYYGYSLDAPDWVYLFHPRNTMAGYGVEEEVHGWVRHVNAMKGIYVNNQGQIKNNRTITIKVDNSIALPLDVLNYVETLVPVKRS